MSEDMTDAVLETIEHALRIHQKILTLSEARSKALDVAASLAGPLGESMDYGTFYQLATILQENDVPGRGAFTGGRALPPPAGTIIRRTRSGEHEPPWPPAGAPCVYILMQDTEVIYVGKSKNVGSRIAGHASKPWSAAEVIVCESETAAAVLEGDLIFQHQPPLNRAGRWERPRTSSDPVEFVDQAPPPSPNVEAFKEEWGHWVFDSTGTPAPLPPDKDLDKSISAWIFGGSVNLAELLDLIPIALDRDGIKVEDRWRYFCGVAWRHVREDR